MSSTLRKQLPVGKDGVLAPRRAAQGADVHVGAWAPQAEKIDLVVNRKRGEALGMVPDNALLIATGQTSPESLRKPLAALIGDDAAVQNLDAVARFGLDPGAFDSAVLVGDFADAVGVFNYTPIGGGRIAPDPAWVSSHIVTEAVPILGSVTCNKFLMPQLKAALAEIVSLGLESTRSTSASTPAATTPATSPAPRRCPTTPSAWPSTSTSPATSAARSARWTAASSRSSSAGASRGAATGATPTRCTSSWPGSSQPG